MKRSNIFWGLIFVMAATLLFLRNMGWIQDFFGYFWVFALLLVGIWLIVSSLTRSVPGNSRQRITVPLEGAAHAILHIDHGAGRLKIGASDYAQAFLEGEFTPIPIIKTSHDADQLIVWVKNTPGFLTWFPGESHDWDLSLIKDVPIVLDIDSGASTSILNLHDLKVTELSLDTGASTTEITLPAAAGSTRVKVDSGAATVRIHIPEGVAAQIRIKSGMASTSVDKRFPCISNNLYLSEDYASATNRADITIETGMASVEID